MRQAAGLVPHGASDRLCREKKERNNTWTNKTHERDARERVSRIGEKTCCRSLASRFILRTAPFKGVCLL